MAGQLDPEGDCNILDRPDIVFGKNLELHGGTHGNRVRSCDAVDSSIDDIQESERRSYDRCGPHPERLKDV